MRGQCSTHKNAATVQTLKHTLTLEVWPIQAGTFIYNLDLMGSNSGSNRKKEQLAQSEQKNIIF